MVMDSSQVKRGVKPTAGEEEPAEKRQRLDSVRLPEIPTHSHSHPPVRRAVAPQPLPAAAARVAARGVHAE